MIRRGNKSGYLADVEKLTALVVRMGGYAEAQLDAAITAANRRDESRADSIQQKDRALDDFEGKVETEARRLLMLERPSEQSLNEILGAMRIAADLERIGDYAANIAKRVRPIAVAANFPKLGAIARMGKLVQELVKDVIDAYAQRDVGKAVDAWHRDEELDDLYTSLHRELLTYMMEDPRNITGYTHLLFTAKNIERVGDHATNIAETVHILITGQPFDKDRPKGDRTSYAVVLPEETALGDPPETLDITDETDIYGKAD